jgi:hypothetical protein
LKINGEIASVTASQLVAGGSWAYTLESVSAKYEGNLFENPINPRAWYPEILLIPCSEDRKVEAYGCTKGIGWHVEVLPSQGKFYYSLKVGAEKCVSGLFSIAQDALRAGIQKAKKVVYGEES